MFDFEKEPKRPKDHSRQNIIVKHNGEEIGMIFAPTWASKDTTWGIRSATGDEIKRRFCSDKEAMDFLNDYFETLVNI